MKKYWRLWFIWYEVYFIIKSLRKHKRAWFIQWVIATDAVNAKDGK